MTKKQEYLYWREWQAARLACKAAGHTEPDRHELHRRALGRDKSSKQFTNQDLDKVLGVFRALSKPANLNAQVRQLRQDRTRLTHKILNEQLPCLAVCLRSAYWLSLPIDEQQTQRLFSPLTLDDHTRAEKFIQPLLLERFKTTDLQLISDQPKPRPDGSEKSDLECLRDTLDARINQKRNEAGLTIHEMRTAAAVKCNCKKCTSPKYVPMVPSVPSETEPCLT